jgi:hypothetical protein
MLRVKRHVLPIHPPICVVGDPSNISRDLAHQSMESAQEKPADGKGNNNSDVIMADDCDLPVYLVLMIGYLCGVALD